MRTLVKTLVGAMALCALVQSTSSAQEAVLQRSINFACYRSTNHCFEWHKHGDIWGVVYGDFVQILDAYTEVDCGDPIPNTHPFSDIFFFAVPGDSVNGFGFIDAQAEVQEDPEDTSRVCFDSSATVYTTRAAWKAALLNFSLVD